MYIDYNSNKQAYDNLFKALSDSIDGHPQISTLTEYFREMENLRKNGYDTNEKRYIDLAPEFLRLPLEEEPFVINGNTREIIIPDHFKKNGVAVAGDTLAEVVYFEAPRYFDAMDLTTCDIDIYWQNGNTEGISPIYNLEVSPKVNVNKTADPSDDIEDETKIMFGWILGGEATKTAGTLKFIIRFTRKVDDNADSTKISYRYQTKEASCTVQPTLAQNNGDLKYEDLTDLIASRPLYSGIVSTLSGASYPSISVDWEDIIDNLTESNNVLTVTASSPDGGSLDYVWYKNNSVIIGEQTNSYTIPDAGEYYVSVGNTVQEKGVRYRDSKHCVVVGPNAISFNGTMDAYAFSKPEGSTNSLSLVVPELENCNGDASYQWYKDDGDGTFSKLVGKQASTYVVDNGTNETVYCEVTNTKNHSTYTIKTDPTIVRIEPQDVIQGSADSETPGTGYMTYDDVSHRLVLTVIPRDKYATYECIWYKRTSGPQKTEKMAVQNDKYISDFTPDAADVYFCEVYEIRNEGTRGESKYNGTHTMIQYEVKQL